jgi:hypothetical protein
MPLNPNPNPHSTNHSSKSFSAVPTSPLNSKFGLFIADIAMQLEPLATILIRHGITKTQWLMLQRTPAFIQALTEQMRAFQSIGNIPDRIRIKAQLLTEEMLQHMHDIAVHPNQPATARVSAFSAVRNLTGLEKPEQALPQRQFNLTINLPDGSKKTATAVTLEAVRIRDETDQDGSVLEEESEIKPEATNQEESNQNDQTTTKENIFSAVSSAAVRVPPVKVPTWSSFRTTSNSIGNHPDPETAQRPPNAIDAADTVQP